MALISGLLGILGRFAGRLLNSTLGWATILLFGKVTGTKQTVLLGITLGSLVWVLLLVGVAMPNVGSLLIAAVPVPPFVDETWIRVTMLIGAVILPLVIGAAAIAVADRDRRPHGLGLVTAVIRGYPFAVVLSITVVVLAVVASVRKVRALARRWEDAHVPIVVKPEGYDELLRQLQEVLRTQDLDVERHAAPRVLSTLPRILARVAGTGLDALVPDRLALLKADQLEALVYPSDIALLGSKSTVAAARARIASQLTRAPVYLTASAASERVEDELRAITEAHAGPEAGRRRLEDVDRRLQELTVPFEEWETVYRERLQVERDLLATGDAARAAPDFGPGGSPAPSPDPLGRAIGAAVFAAMVLDVCLLLASRLRGADRGRRRTI